MAYACLAIEKDPTLAAEYTSRANLVGVITNGTAVLGLGDIGPLAGKPVMEGKGCLFKKFAGIDVFDIELAEHDPDKLVDIIAALEPTLGGINLEDIKAPECFYIEKKLRERLNIPVFHDDQHGTAIISAAALLNGLELVGKNDRRHQARGLGRRRRGHRLPGRDGRPGREAARTSSSATRKGVVREGRGDKLDEIEAALLPEDRGAHAGRRGEGRRRVPRLLGRRRADAEMVKTMADKPIILALANPEPEIRPELAKAARPDCIIATGRSDYPNQVNNVLCFPYIFRGALDCGATKINEAMKLACVREIAALAKAETSDEVAAAYAGQRAEVRPRLPDPHAFRRAPDPAHRAGGGAGGGRVGRGHAADRRPGGLPPELSRFVYQTGMFMRPVFAAAKAACDAAPPAWSMPRARTSACCARCRWCWTKAWRGRSWSAGRR